MPRRKRNLNREFESITVASIDDQPCSSILQENTFKNKRIELVGDRRCEVVLKKISENELLQKCIGVNKDNKMLQKCNSETVNATNIPKNETPQESMHGNEHHEMTPKMEYVREHSGSVLRYKGSSTRGYFLDHNNCSSSLSWCDDVSSGEEYVPLASSKTKSKYEEDFSWSPPNKKIVKLKRASKRSSTSSGRNELSNFFPDNSSKSSTDLAGNWNNKSETGRRKQNLVSFDKKRKAAQPLIKCESVHSKTFNLNASIQPLLQYPAVETKAENSVKSTPLQHIESNQETEEVEDDDDCTICYVAERKATRQATLPNDLLNKYVLHCRNYQLFDGNADSACVNCNNFVELDSIKILAVADLEEDPKEYVGQGLRHAEAEYEGLKNPVKPLVEEHLKLKMVKTRITILKKAMDLLLEFGSFENYVMESDVF